MNILENVSLRSYSTMHLGGISKYLVSVNSEQEMIEAINHAILNNLKTIVIGTGSNILWRDEGFDGLVIVNNILGVEIKDLGESQELRIGAGENWDKIVEKTVSLGLSGIECLSAIPGSSGATPVQNVGAYGQEIKNVLISVEAIDKVQRKKIIISNEDCDLSYRNSVFRKNPGRYSITYINIKLNKKVLSPPFYKDLENYFLQNNITSFDPEIVRKAVIEIRKIKLPSPKDYYNLGSFFKNPIISKDLFDSLKIKYPEIKAFEDPNGYKVSAAWLIEKAGYSNYSDPQTGMATWKNNPLILVNELAKSTKDVLDFRDHIVSRVLEMFEIELEQEPLLLP